jgi:hypothetical protein
MRQLLHAARACLALALLLPVSPASAESPAEKCTFRGSAIFTPTNLKPLPTANLGYEFNGRVECESLPAREIRKGIVEVKGAETLSCAGSLGEAEGKGTLNLEGVELPFGLTFYLGGPGSTLLSAKFGDGGVAVGTAAFLESEIEPATECFALSGAHVLEFKGAVIGEL